MGNVYKQALIIDDDEDICSLLKTLLSKSIPKVSYVHTLEMGKNFITEENPDVIFLDNNLPDGQGVEMLGEIRSLLPGCLIIIITAVGSTKADVIKWSPDAIIEKPLTAANIIKALEESKFKAK